MPWKVFAALNTSQNENYILQKIGVLTKICVQLFENINPIALKV